MNLEYVKFKTVSVLMGLFVAVLFMQMGVFIAHQLFGLNVGWNLFQVCLSLTTENTVPHLIVKAVIDLFIAYTMARVIWKLGKQAYLSGKWSGVLQQRRHAKLTRKYNHKYRKWGYEFLIVQDDAFLAFTMGLLRPKIVISTGALNAFGESEMQVILRHERYHCMRRDPMKVFLSTLLVDGFGYIPVFKSFHHYYKTCKELFADRYVIKSMGSEYELGKVLVKLSAIGTIPRPAAGVPFSNTAINYRMLQVLQPGKPVHVPFFRLKPVSVSLFMIFLFTAAIGGGCA